MTDQISADNPGLFLEEIDLVRSLPDTCESESRKLTAAKAVIREVLLDFFKTGNISFKRLEMLDSFLFIFNRPDFSEWHKLNWWEQREKVLKIKDLKSYRDRACLLLQHSCLAPYLNYSDDMVAKSSDQEVKQAWMRKRLVLQECFWNAIDSISHAAYHNKKYEDMLPVLCLVLCNVTDAQNRKQEFFFGIDNGIGYLYKKKSRDSALFRLFYKAFKYLLRSGVFYIGGLELGLLETDGNLSCHGAGAVVYQGW